MIISISPDFVTLFPPDQLHYFILVFILFTVVVIRLPLVIFFLQVKSSGARAGFTKRRRSERKVTKMVVVIVVVFVLCWLPFFIINMINLVVIIPESSATAGIYFFAVILSYANSCANPVLYGFLSENFKQSFTKVGLNSSGYEQQIFKTPYFGKIIVCFSYIENFWDIFYLTIPSEDSDYF